MTKIQRKMSHWSNDKNPEQFEVYGTRRYRSKVREYDHELTEDTTEFLIYDYGDWLWVDSKYYEPTNNE